MCNDIIFGAAPANGASLFVTVLGSTVGIGTPSNNTVTTAILQNGSVTTAKIVDANVTTAKIANGAVTVDKLGAGAVTNAKLASSAVGAGNLQTNAVETAKIQDLAVTEAKIGATAVTASKIAQNAVSLDKLPLGNSTVDGKFLRANNGSAPTFETVNTDLVADTSPQLGGLLETNGHNIKLANTNKILLGTTSSYEIYNDSANLIIDQNTDGQVTYIRGKQNGTIQFDASDTGNQVAAKFKFSNDSTPIASAELYHNNTKRFETTSTGTTTTGVSSTTSLSINSSSGYIGLPDSAKIFVGTGNDLQIYHNGTDSYVEDNGAGELRLATNSVVRITKGASETLAAFSADGSAELWYDNNRKLETSSSGVTVTGTCTATAFAGDGSALTGITSFVTGMILIWSGAANAIPSGWYLCDGTNGTPNLTERFVVGAGGGGNSSVNSSPYSVGATGGAISASDTVNISVSVSGTTGYDGSHSNGSSYSHSGHASIKRHNHSFSGSGSGSDTVTIATRPPYYALCYIMKS